MIVRSKKESDGTVVLSVLEECLDRVSVPEFKTEASRVVGDSDGCVEVDCTVLEFIDSSGLGAFLHVHNLLPERRRPVRLTGVGPKVLTLLELMQVHRVFEISTRN